MSWIPTKTLGRRHIRNLFPMWWVRIQYKTTRRNYAKAAVCKTAQDWGGTVIDPVGMAHIAFLTPPDQEQEDDGYDVLEPHTIEELQDAIIEEEMAIRGLLKEWRSI